MHKIYYRANKCTLFLRT